MDYLQYIDAEVPKEYIDRVEVLIQNELGEQADHIQVHPNAQKFIDNAKMLDTRFDKSLYDEFLAITEPNDRKRGIDDVIDKDFLNYYGKKYPRIELQRYSQESDKADELSITNAYLDHQILTLKNLLPKTILNQWSINNDNINYCIDKLDSENKKQHRQINDLNKYREKLQIKHKPEFEQLQDKYYNALIDRLLKR